jgi:hypothetical protein
MNLAWEQNWLEQFDNRLEELMANYGERFEYEDMNLGVRIVDDKPALRRLFETFENKDPDRSTHHFQATRYHGDLGNPPQVGFSWAPHRRQDDQGSRDHDPRLRRGGQDHQGTQPLGHGRAHAPGRPRRASDAGVLRCSGWTARSPSSPEQVRASVPPSRAASTTLAPR